MPLTPISVQTFLSNVPLFRELAPKEIDRIAAQTKQLRLNRGSILFERGDSIGEPTMGEIDEAFDRECIGHFESGNQNGLVEFLSERLPIIGNGASEIRNWVTAHGAAGGRGFELIDYSAVPEVYVGCGFAAWNLNTASP